jgi:hypothetical protein
MVMMVQVVKIKACEHVQVEIFGQGYIGKMQLAVGGSEGDLHLSYIQIQMELP